MATVVLVTAFHQEAEPIIEALGLARIHRAQGLVLYGREETLLLETGLGKLRACAGLSRLLATVPSAGLTVLNIGVCGGLEPGTLFMINKVCDQESGGSYFPEMHLVHQLPEASLVTVGSVQKNIISPEVVYDMEGSGICEAALGVLPRSQLALLKVVSDAGEAVSPEHIRTVISAQCEPLVGIIELYKTFGESLRATLSSKDEESIIALAAKQGASQTEINEILGFARSYLARKGDLSQFLDYLRQAPIVHKLRAPFLRKVLQ